VIVGERAEVRGRDVAERLPDVELDEVAGAANGRSVDPSAPRKSVCAWG